MQRERARKNECVCISVSVCACVCVPVRISFCTLIVCLCRWLIGSHGNTPPLHSVSDITSTGTREVMRSDSLSFLRPSDHRPHARSRLLPGSVEGGCPSSCPKLTPARALEGTRASPPPQGSTLSLVHPPPPHLHLPLLIRLLPHCTQRLKSLPSQNKWTNKTNILLQTLGLSLAFVLFSLFSSQPSVL